MLFTDHQPLEKLGKVHTKTLNRLQEAMLTFDFEIVYKKGSEMPADFLSRNMVVDSISFDEDKSVSVNCIKMTVSYITEFYTEDSAELENQTE